MSGEGRREAHARSVAASAPVSVDQVSDAVAEWVDQVGRFLGVLQVALAESRPKDDASPEVRALSGQLPALIRQCRAQVPTPEMIRTWVKSLCGEATGAEDPADEDPGDEEPQHAVAVDA